MYHQKKVCYLVKFPLLNLLCELKRIKSPIQNPVIQQKILMLMINIDNLFIKVLDISRNICRKSLGRLQSNDV